MKNDENRILKEVIELGIKPIPNKDFTSSTIDKIRAMEAEKPTVDDSINSLILSPIFIFILLFELFSVLKFIDVIVPGNLDTRILQITAEISNIILNPAILTITLSFLILYYFDIYLKKKVSAKTKDLAPWELRKNISLNARTPHSCNRKTLIIE